MAARSSRRVATFVPVTSPIDSARTTIPEWKTVAFDATGETVVPNGSIGFRWGAEGRTDAGKWNLEAKEGRRNADVKLKLSLLENGGQKHEVVEVAFPYFAGATRRTSPTTRSRAS